MLGASLIQTYTETRNTKWITIAVGRERVAGNISLLLCGSALKRTQHC